MQKIIRVIYNQEKHMDWIIKLFEVVNYGVKKDPMAHLGVHFEVVKSADFHYDISKYEKSVYHIFLLHEREEESNHSVEGAYIPTAPISSFFEQLNRKGIYHNFHVVSGGIFYPFESRIIMSTKNFNWKTEKEKVDNLNKIIFSILVQWYQFLNAGKTEKIFLSHKSVQGKPIIDETEFRQFLDKTKLLTFIDRSDVVDCLDENLENGIIESSAVIVIYTDDYLDSYWCDFELLTAKSHNVPILVLDYIQNGNYEIHECTTNSPFLKRNDTLDQIGIALFQVLIRRYFLKLNVKDEKVLYAKPSNIDFVNNNADANYVYAFPPLTSQQKQLVRKYTKQLTLIGETKDICLNNYQLMLSTSEITNEKSTLLKEEYRVLVQIIFLYFISKKANVVYTGNIEYTNTDYNIVKFLIDMNEKYQKLNEDYNANTSANNHLIIYGERNQLNVDCLEQFAQKKFKLKSGKNDQEKRIESIAEVDVVVLFAGKTEGYSGLLPGLVQEYFLARKRNKIIYIIGGYGGVAEKIGQYLYENKDWDLSLNESQLNNKKKQISEMSAFFGCKELDFSKMSLRYLEEKLEIPQRENNGLSDKDNKKLSKTTDIYEALNLIGKGLSKCAK